MSDQATIDRLNNETLKLAAEARKLDAEAWKLVAERYKLAAEQMKLTRDHALAPWLVTISGLTAGAALLGAGVLLGRFMAGNI